MFYSHPIDYRQLVWKMRKFLAEIKIDDAPDLASHQWNADETGFCLQLLLDVFWQGEDRRESIKLQGALEENMSQYLAVVQQMEADYQLTFYVKV